MLNEPIVVIQDGVFEQSFFVRWVGVAREDVVAEMRGDVRLVRCRLETWFRLGGVHVTDVVVCGFSFVNLHCLCAVHSSIG